MISEIEEALERYYIMTTEPDVTEEQALNYITKKYGALVSAYIREEMKHGTKQE